MPPRASLICISMNKSPEKAGKKLFFFKQFSLTDQGCAMKIGTDGVLLGSIAASYSSEKTLDAGTGCGLITLMLAQKSEAEITAIELDREAVAVARENVENSPWSRQIKVVHANFIDFASETNAAFDLIVCNPPFFRNSLQSADLRRSMARHSHSLTADDLMAGTKKLLNANGCFLVIVPFDDRKSWIDSALAMGLHCRSEWRIIPVKGLKPKRSILAFYHTAGNIEIKELAIETGAKRHDFTAEYKALTKDYYPAF